MDDLDRLIQVRSTAFELMHDLRTLITRIDSYRYKYRGTDDNDAAQDDIMDSIEDVRRSMGGMWPLDPNAKRVPLFHKEPDLRGTEQERYNFGRHAVLIHKDGMTARREDGKPFSVEVWLNADKGNTSRNPEFKVVKSKRTWSKHEYALQYGRRLCEAASQKGQDNRGQALE